jgi:hypothetical protein
MARGRTAAEHYTQAQRNEAFYRQIGGSQSPTPEWAVTALFYTVVHEIEAALRAAGHAPSRDHRDRKAKIRKLSRALAKEYESIERLSRQARYDCIRHSQMHIALAEARLPFIRAKIAEIAPPPYN